MYVWLLGIGLVVLLLFTSGFAASLTAEDITGFIPTPAVHIGTIQLLMIGCVVMLMGAGLIYAL